MRALLTGLSNCERNCLNPCLILTISVLTACALHNPISNEVRAGGTVMVMVDGVRHNMPQAADLTAIFEDNANVIHTCTVREVLRVNADPTSLQGIGRGTNIPAYQGQLLAIVDMPDHDPDNLIALGEGALTITNNNNAPSTSRTHPLTIFDYNAEGTPPTPSNALSQTYYPDGSGSWPMNHWVNTRSMPHVILKTAVNANYDDVNTDVAGATFVVRRVDADWPGADWGVTKLVQDPNLQLSWKKMASPVEGESDIIIHLSNPQGFLKQSIEPSTAAPYSLLKDLSAVAIVWWDDGSGGGGSSAYIGVPSEPFEFIEEHYYDINGVEITTGLSMQPIRQH